MRPENTCITLTFMYFCPLSQNGEGKTNGMKQVLPSVTSYLFFCYGSGLAHFFYTARVESEFPYTHIRFRKPETDCTHM